MLLKELPIEARVRDCENQMTFLVCAQDHPGYGGTTLMAERLVGVGCFDAGERSDGHSNPRKAIWEDVSSYGNNNYLLSNMQQWLNSDSRDWYKDLHELDMPPIAQNLRYNEHPYKEKPGFLAGFSKMFQDALIEVDVQVLVREGRDKGALQTIRSKVFLPSRTEIGKGDESGFAEGKMMPIFHDPTILKAKPTDEDMAKYGRSWNPTYEDIPLDAPQIYDPKFGWWFWLRTASMKYAYLIRVMSPYGAVSYTFANNDSVGIRPVLNLDSSLEILSDNDVFNETFTIVSGA